MRNKIDKSKLEIIFFLQEILPLGSPSRIFPWKSHAHVCHNIFLMDLMSGLMDLQYICTTIRCESCMQDCCAVLCCAVLPRVVKVQLQLSKNAPNMHGHESCLIIRSIIIR